MSCIGSVRGVRCHVVGLRHSCPHGIGRLLAKLAALVATAASASVCAGGQDLQDLIVARNAAPAEDLLVHEMRLGLSALRGGDREQAAASLDRVLYGIEAVYANTEGALAARSLWQEEGRKVFKGEPYERVMAYLYRGVVHLQEGEYDTARAAFEGGALQDAFAEDLQFRSDFHTMALLSAWSSHLNGDAELAAERLREFNDDTGADVSIGQTSCLAVAESGAGPRKLLDGVGGYKLVYRRGKNIDAEHAFLSHDEGYIAYPVHVEDLYWQARTRGRREFDAIIEGKVRFVNEQEARQDFLFEMENYLGWQRIAYRQLMTENSNVQVDVGVPGTAGSALGVAGAVAGFLMTKPKLKADKRAWDNLPDRLHAFVFPCERADKGLAVRFTDSVRQDLGVALPVTFSGDRTFLLGPGFQQNSPTPSDALK